MDFRDFGSNPKILCCKEKPHQRLRCSQKDRSKDKNFCRTYGFSNRTLNNFSEISSQIGVHHTNSCHFQTILTGSSLKETHRLIFNSKDLLDDSINYHSQDKIGWRAKLIKSGINYRRFWQMRKYWIHGSSNIVFSRIVAFSARDWRAMGFVRFSMDSWKKVPENYERIMLEIRRGESRG